MIICSASSRIARKVGHAGSPIAELPSFLCPGLLQFWPSSKGRCSSYRLRTIQDPPRQRFLSTTSSGKGNRSYEIPSIGRVEKLPRQCPGCGAYSQLVDAEGPGFYTLTRKSVRDYLGTGASHQQPTDDVVLQAALAKAGKVAATLNLGSFSSSERTTEHPTCDRCHDLKHHSVGVSIRHPSVDSIQDTIFESPHKYNHIYHIIDAADFPMSLVPSLHKLLHLTPQRSLNRRAKTGRFYHGRKTEVSFIITRSDLLAPLKEQVDSMMPYLRETLRDALGRSAKDVRLGNIKCVSAKRQWWTKELKEEIWKRGGGGWMVGKVNVGKSQLFHDVFPKGRRDQKSKTLPIPVSGKESHSTTAELAEDSTFGTEDAAESVNNSSGTLSADGIPEEVLALDRVPEMGDSTIPDSSAEDSKSDSMVPEERQTSTADDFIDNSTLLPALQPETDYPTMPLVSSLPGTTASPIRLSFGSGKGELIDLPGLSRGDLELHVKPEHRQSLVMRSRVVPEQQTLKPGHSLLLGGFIRITPTHPDVIVLAYAFTPLEAHRTSTAKAIQMQDQTWEGNVENIALPETAAQTKSAGIFPLKWDVTRQRTGPVTNPAAGGVKPDNLPYRVLSTDILIEGCGWVELVAQVRRRRNDLALPALPEAPLDEEEQEAESRKGPTDNDSDPSVDVKIEQGEVADPDWPAVEVFTPNGKFVGARRPMNAWLHVASKPKKGSLQGRPRKAMKGTKKVEKRNRRALGTAG